MAVQFETSRKETLAAIKEKKHKVYKCRLCDKKSSTRYGLKMHKNQTHPEEGGPQEADRSGKRKVDSVVGRLTNKQTGNTIRTTAGFMVVENSGENEEPEEPEEAPENKKKRKGANCQSVCRIQSELKTEVNRLKSTVSEPKL